MGIFRKQKITTATTQSSLDSTILRSLHDALVIVDQKGTIQFANPSADAILGVTSDLSSGVNFASIIHLIDQNGDPIPDSQTPIAVALRTHQYADCRNCSLVNNKTNAKVPVWLTVVPVNNQAGTQVITIRDIAKEVKEEQARSEFISTASHEMRTPVASIEGYLGLALSPTTATIDVRAKEYLDKAHEASQHLGKLFRDLLDTTKLDDGKFTARPSPVEMTPLVKDIADGMAPSIAAKGLKYIYGDAPTSAIKLHQILHCSLDIDFLREIINNIIENAIKYTISGSVSVSVYGDTDNAIITISDTGIGISREDQKHIFQKFYRADNSDTRVIGGTGLGLYITKQRVDAMHGRIWVESELGKGSKFYIAFPRITAEEYSKQKLAQSSNMIPQPVVTVGEAATHPSPPPPVADSSPSLTKSVSDLPPDYLATLKQKFAQDVQASSPMPVGDVSPGALSKYAKSP